MIINFFEYKQNCQEFKVLLKSTSENASRKDLKEGQQLFKSIYQNIVAIEQKISDIEQTITKRNIEIIGTVEKKILNLEKLIIEYEPHLEKNLKIPYQEETEYYYHEIQPRIDQILKFLDSDFDHERHKKELLNMKKQIEENKADIFTKLSFNSKNFPIEKSIEVVLEHYSIISSELMDYLNIFLKHI